MSTAPQTLSYRATTASNANALSKTWGAKQPPSATATRSPFPSNSERRPWVSFQHRSRGPESPRAQQAVAAHTRCLKLGSPPLPSHHGALGKVHVGSSWTGCANTTPGDGARLPGGFYLLGLAHQQPSSLLDPSPGHSRFPWVVPQPVGHSTDCATIGLAASAINASFDFQVVGSLRLSWCGQH